MADKIYSLILATRGARRRVESTIIDPSLENVQVQHQIWNTATYDCIFLS